MKSHLSTISSLIILTAAGSAQGRVLVVSGGGGPTGNHYSQYLQTKTLADYLREAQGTDLNVFFGAGNNDETKANIADVHKMKKQNGMHINELLVGSIEKNNPATLENVSEHISKEATKPLSPKETFFLFVSDHGMPNRNDEGQSDESFDDNCIDMWGFALGDSDDTFVNLPFSSRCFSRSNLEKQLKTSYGDHRKVFSMSQCFSGGFHKMSVKNISTYPSADVNLCGFTAITEDDVASGCTPDVDGPNYQGYERFFTEQLTGKDVVSGQTLRPARTSVFEAHEAATLQDLTKDIPLTTLDFYLWKWSLRFLDENFNARTASKKISKPQTIFEDAMAGEILSKNPEALRREGFISRQTEEILGAYPELSSALPNARLEKFAAIFEQIESEGQENMDAYSKIYKTQYLAQRKIREEWTRAFDKKSLVYRNADQEKFENLMQELSQNYGEDSVEWIVIMLMARKTILDPQKAQDVFFYLEQRKEDQEEWALKIPELRDEVLKSREAELSLSRLSDESVRLQKKSGLVRRLMIYRLALGALITLEEIKDQKAQTEIRGLTECLSARLQ